MRRAANRLASRAFLVGCALLAVALPGEHARAADYQVYAVGSSASPRGVYRYTSAGAQVDAGAFTNGFAFTDAPFSLELDGAGDLYVSTEVDGVRKFSGASGAYTAVHPPFGVYAGAGGHRGMDFDPATGELYASINTGGSINRWPSGGASTQGTVFVDPTGSSFDVTVGPDGNVYLSDETTITRYTTAAVGPSQSTNTGSTIYRLAFGPDLTDDGKAELFVSNAGASISAYDVLGDPGNPGDFLATIATGFSIALGFNFAPDGDLYVPDFGTGTIYRYSPNGLNPWSGAAFASLSGVSDIQFVIIPEPASVALVILGAAATLGRPRRRF